MPLRPKSDAAQIKNRLLRRLDDNDLQQLWPHLEPTALKPRRMLHHPGTEMEHVYFIESGLVSVLARTGPAKSVETWLIGNEGLVGVPVILGQRISTHGRLVQVEGSALRIPASIVRGILDDNATIRRVILRYIQSIIVQTSQNGACNAHHSVSQRLAKWLLAASDKSGSDELPLPQHVLARMLGVRRATVGETIAALERQGALARSRSVIRIEDRRRLEAAACYCYRVIRAATWPRIEP
ncbi:MAG TPA: Crp/Fnr family transcriptional regulator [Alphaproteobacteria bacterium]|jgi:CRP-like cAMP-binding protein|nr:Crp/Fnr family transcriptional regulator [Alphaproteobacteria bacterium]